MIAIASTRDARPDDVYLTNRRGQVLVDLTNRERSQDLIGPLWHPDSAMATFIHVYVPYYDGFTGRQEYSLGFSVQRSGVRERRRRPDLDPSGLYPFSNVWIRHELDGESYQIVQTGPGDFGTRSLTSGSDNTHPTLCGDRLVFLSDRSNTTELYSMDLDGGNIERLAPGVPAYPPVCAPSGDRVAMFSGHDDRFDVYVVAMDGSGFLNVSRDPVGVGSFSWSPDGLALAFSSRRDGNSEIYVAGVQGNWLQNVTNHPAEDTGPAWLSPQDVARLTLGALIDESSLRRKAAPESARRE